MAKLTMPKINITFESIAASIIAHSSKGVVLLILRDTALGGKHYTITDVTEIPEGLSAANQRQIKNALIGYVDPPKKVLVHVIDSGENTLTAALKWAATQGFDYLCGPADVTAEEAETIGTWIKSQRANNYAIYKAVLPDYAGDSEAIVNFSASGIETADGTYTAAEYCSRIAGLIAGTPMRISSTYATLPEVMDVTRLTISEQDEAVGAGKYILWSDGMHVLTGRAVNSLQTTTDIKGDQFKKIKLVEIIDMMHYDIRTAVRTDYIGKYANTYANKMLLVAVIRGYMQTLEADSLINSGWELDLDVSAQKAWLEANGTDTSEMTTQQIREADTGSHVFLKMSCKPLDAIEDVDLVISI